MSLRKFLVGNRKRQNMLMSALHEAFKLGQRFGVDVLPRHFYSSIPDVNELERTKSWRKPRSMVGVSGADLDEQIAFVRECCTPEMQEWMRAHGADLWRRTGLEHDEVSGYGPIESDFLYSFIRTHTPNRVVQIGAGVSTSVILQALADADKSSQVTCIDPYPTASLKRMAAAGKIALVSEKAQEAERSHFTGLGEGDLFFVDSTHTVKTGSEVNEIVLEILPRLARGCYVHFHDIYFPYDYQPSLLKTVFFLGESVFLHAFLVNNSRFSIAACLSMLHYGRVAEMQALLPNYEPAKMPEGLRGLSQQHFPSATYLRVL